jgi:hypothetical protein
VRARIPGGKWLSSIHAHRWYADPRVSIHPEIRKEESRGLLPEARGSLLSASADVGRVQHPRKRRRPLSAFRGGDGSFAESHEDRF